MFDKMLTFLEDAQEGEEPPEDNLSEEMEAAGDDLLGEDAKGNNMTNGLIHKLLTYIQIQ